MRLSGLSLPVAANPALQTFFTQLADSAGLNFNAAGVTTLVDVFNAGEATVGFSQFPWNGSPIYANIYDIGAVFGMSPSQMDAWMMANPGQALKVPYTSWGQLQAAILPYAQNGYVPGYGQILYTGSNNDASPPQEWVTTADPDNPIGPNEMMFIHTIGDMSRSSFRVTKITPTGGTDWLAIGMVLGGLGLAAATAAGVIGGGAAASGVVAEQAAAPVVTAAVTPVGTATAAVTTAVSSALPGLSSTLGASVATAATTATAAGGVASDLTTVGGLLAASAGVVHGATSLENAVSKPATPIIPSAANNYGVGTNISSILSSLMMPALIVGGAYLVSKRRK